MAIDWGNALSGAVKGAAAGAAGGVPGAIAMGLVGLVTGLIPRDESPAERQAREAAEELRALKDPNFRDFLAKRKSYVANKIGDSFLANDLEEMKAAIPEVMDPRVTKGESQTMGILNRMVGGKLPLEYLAEIKQAQEEAASTSRGNRQAILSHLQATGGNSGGAGIGLQNMANVSAANKASSDALSILANRQKLGKDAAVSLGDYVSKLRAQKAQESEALSGRQDAMGKFRTELQSNITAANIAAMNRDKESRETELEKEQLSQIDVHNRHEADKAAAYRDEYQDKLDRISLKAGYGKDRANAESAADAASAKSRSDILDGIGGAMNAGAKKGWFGKDNIPVPEVATPAISIALNQSAPLSKKKKPIKYGMLNDPAVHIGKTDEGY